MLEAAVWTDLDDSSSFTGSTYSTTTSSTVLGPGAITGKFLKALGEKSLDLIVIVVVRNRLAGIERVLEKNPRLLRNPSGDEWQRLIEIYKDLHELCRESRSDYYPLSVQKAAANLIQNITAITRAAPEFYIEASPTNEKWEALLAHVQRRGALLEDKQRSAKRSSSLSFNFGSSPTSDKWKTLTARIHRRRKSTDETQDVVPRLDKRNSNSSCLEPPESPNKDNNGIVKNEKRNSYGPEDIRRSRRASAILDHIFKPRNLEPEFCEPTRRVLVLGAGGVGKSTLVKQIQAAVNISSSQDTEAYGEVILNNTIDSMRNILRDVDPLELSNHGRECLEIFDNLGVNWTPSEANLWLRNALMTLWMEPAVRHSAHRARLGMLPEFVFESADYFFDSADQIFSSSYEPSHEDIVRSRVRTTGIWENHFQIQNNPWVLTDTGGERSERKKWGYCLNDATAIIFVVALSDYNKTLYEDGETNRMEESLSLFESVANSPHLAKSLIVLIFNKIDIFVETSQSSPLRNYFPDYIGDDCYDACQYFERRFLSLIKDKSRRAVIRYTCAVSTDETSGTFWSIQEEIDKHHASNVTLL